MEIILFSCHDYRYNWQYDSSYHPISSDWNHTLELTEKADVMGNGAIEETLFDTKPLHHGGLPSGS